MKKLSLMIALVAGSPAAADLLLGFPLECSLGQNCFIQNYVDRLPGEGVQDFACAARSYNGHKGTDFSLNNMIDMERGVAVLAVAAGVVRGVRDGLPDILTTAPDAPDISGKECGNGVAIDHGNGWETLSCHMKRGSVTVRQGDRIQAGQQIGQIGASGNTQFPHLHLQVSKDGKIIDPFSSDKSESCNIADPKTMWEEEIGYTAGGLISIGIDVVVPSFAEIKVGIKENPTRQRTETPALVVWGYGHGVAADDQISLSLTGPKGEVFSDTKVHPKNQAQFFYAVGRKKPTLGWPRGNYTGLVEMRRDGVLVDQKAISFTLE
ncbi:Peptidase M23B [Rhodobacterales bacterium HTCC2150]|nr:Peptidase M23B [Rhodobacterales bacterium HTCC2150] [Rhodobacteraceae bacterium HTCC2150]